MGIIAAVVGFTMMIGFNYLLRSGGSNLKRVKEFLAILTLIYGVKIIHIAKTYLSTEEFNQWAGSQEGFLAEMGGYTILVLMVLLVVNLARPVVANRR